MCGGDPMLDLSSYTKAELFPACAGVILLVCRSTMDCRPFPRMCGGDPYTDQSGQQWVCFSPHTRG